jgi:hypothetical protein
LKNKFLVLKKKIMVLGFSLKDILEGQALKTEEYTL